MAHGQVWGESADVTTLVVVACGAAKVWKTDADAGPTRAPDAYVGAPFKVNKEYAIRLGDRWFVLSAKYGFINPDFVIPEDYNVTFDEPRTNPISVAALKRQIATEKLSHFEKVVVLASRMYARIAAEAFAGSGAKICSPYSWPSFRQDDGSGQAGHRFGDPVRLLSAPSCLGRVAILVAPHSAVTTANSVKRPCVSTLCPDLMSGGAGQRPARAAKPAAPPSFVALWPRHWRDGAFAPNG